MVTQPAQPRAAHSTIPNVHESGEEWTVGPPKVPLRKVLALVLPPQAWLALQEQAGEDDPKDTAVALLCRTLGVSAIDSLAEWRERLAHFHAQRTAEETARILGTTHEPRVVEGRLRVADEQRRAAHAAGTYPEGLFPHVPRKTGRRAVPQPTTLYAPPGAAIRTQRIRVGWSQRQLAKAAGFSRALVAWVETGQRDEDRYGEIRWRLERVLDSVLA